MPINCVLIDRYWHWKFDWKTIHRWSRSRGRAPLSIAWSPRRLIVYGCLHNSKHARHTCANCNNTPIFAIWGCCQLWVELERGESRIIAGEILRICNDSPFAIFQLETMTRRFIHTTTVCKCIVASPCILWVTFHWLTVVACLTLFGRRHQFVGLQNLSSNYLSAGVRLIWIANGMRLCSLVVYNYHQTTHDFSSIHTLVSPSFRYRIASPLYMQSKLRYNHNVSHFPSTPRRVEIDCASPEHVVVGSAVVPSLGQTS